MKIFGDRRSGNCLKVAYVADLLSLPYEWCEIDVLSGYTRSEEFLAINPAGQVPAVLFGNGQVLSQSNAIMLYLAEGTPLVPDNKWLRAKMNEWLFWEQYTHEPSIAVVRFLVALKGQARETCDPKLLQKGEGALDLMEKHLPAEGYFVGECLSLADIALYAYTQFAQDGGFSLKSRPATRAWLTRVASDLGI